MSIRTPVHKRNPAYGTGLKAILKVAIFIALAIWILAHMPRSCSHHVKLVGSISGPIGGVAINGNYVYIGEGEHFTVLDVSGFSTPKVRARLRLPDIFTEIAVSGSLAFVSDGGTGLQIIDVSDPLAPVQLGSIDLPGIGSVSDVAVSGSLAYVAAYESGLQIIDVSDPSAPVLVGRYDSPDSASGIALSGSLVYVACGRSGLQIIDVSDPSAPVLVGSYDTPGFAFGVAVSGSVTYVADFDSGLQIIDVSDPLAPVLVGFYATQGQQVIGVALSSSLAYVASYPLLSPLGRPPSGLQIVDVSDPSAPVLVGRFDTPGPIRDIAVSGSVAYVVDGEGGLAILRYTGPIPPPR